MFVRGRLLTFALIAGVLPIAGARADINNTGQVFISPSFSGGSGPFSQTVTQPGLISIAGSATGGFSSSGDSSLTVNYGVVRIAADAFGAVGSSGRGIFRDSITITAPGVPTGTNGTLTFTLRVGGTFNAPSGFSATTWGVQADVGGGAFDLNKSGKVNSPEVPPAGYSGDAFGDYSATIFFVYGFAMPLDVEFNATAGAGYGNSGAGGADYNLYLYWQGITDVKANGVPVGSFGVSSGSGTDWSHARCPSDFNGDGFVDGIDYDAFNNLFEAGDLAADYNNDGFVDGIDYDLFNNDFEAGC